MFTVIGVCTTSKIPLHHMNTIFLCRYIFMAANILATLMIIVFLVAFLVVRFKTVIEALLLRLFDYRIPVFLGYADDDYGFVRNILLPFLEGELQQTTYVHQRDLRGGFTDQQFFDAIRNSWRVLLVLSRNFLTKYDKAHNVMTYASHSVTAVNQHRLFVLLEESQVHAIPDYLDGLLDDTTIIPLPDLQQPLTYQQKQMIIECLRPTQ
ncbi:unnamed protein product [Candidula unifasciata]|uniref:TIR domain-containing protein n=1 Tax=Candidula unifasciata TaxID=100452 RepID=A0A8S4ABE3_9EUPU|nr:unnamed protein product [Candidula unifasciata]